MNANLIFNWLRDPRFAPETAVETAPGDAVFLPVEVSRNVRGDEAPAEPSIVAADGRVVIELAGGHRIVAEDGYDPDALGRLLRAWLP